MAAKEEVKQSTRVKKRILTFNDDDIVNSSDKKFSVYQLGSVGTEFHTLSEDGDKNDDFKTHKTKFSGIVHCLSVNSHV